MKRFTFSLETVKRLRADAEQQAQADLGRALAVHAEAERLRAERRASLAEIEERLRTASAPAHDLLRADRDREVAVLRLGHAEAGRNAASRAVDGSRMDLAEASRALEILERLEEKRREEHRLAAIAEDDRQIAEIAESRAARTAMKRRR